MEDKIKELLKYLEFKPKRYFDNEFYDAYPDAVNKLWWFFNGRRDRIEQYPELHALYESQCDFLDKFRD